ncbi:ATP-binding protein [Streptomyces sp. NPDC053560]|uniref:ATP-binding protein n=1 Tax=Streptomyces sp. NPDC053560 TaxID=3365711 RepID=UPI0037D581FA
MGEPYTADALYPPIAQSAGRARAWVSGRLNQLAPTHFAPEGLDQCVSELVTNAIRYAPTGYDFRVRLVVDESLVRVEVHDFGDVWAGNGRAAAKDDEHGRGLVLVAACSDAWGVAPHPRRGKAVWCVFKSDAYAVGLAQLDAQ